MNASVAGKSISVMIAVLALLASGTILLAQPVYVNDFEGVVGPGWSKTTTEVTPIGGRVFLGRFQNEAVTLSLGSLPPHSQLVVSFDLYVIGTWDGSLARIATGPDLWQIKNSGTVLFKTTFSNVPFSGYWNMPENQAYPGIYPGGDNPAGTGASEINTLGYPGNIIGSFFSDSVYHLSLTFPHTSDAVALTFDATEMNFVPGNDSERWGLDNIVIDVPEPATLSLLALGGLAMLRRGKRCESTRPHE